MRDKGIALRHLNARTVKTALFGALCRIRPVRAWLNYYEDAVGFEDVAVPGSVRSVVVRPARDYGLSFTEAELRDVLNCTAADIGALELTYKMARVRDVTILGSSGVTLDDRSGRALFLDPSWRTLPRNWMVARPLKAMTGAAAATYVNLLGVRRGHRHFAHFFWDTMVPLTVYLKTWHDPAERVICLVREDLSPVQRDAFRFLAEDHPGLSFATLGPGEKMRCPNSIYLAYLNRGHGKDNALARDALTDIRDLFLKHYDITSSRSGTGRRVYVSRNDAAVRRVKNEADVVELLRSRGFEVHQPGRMPFRDQAALFHSAGIIVAPHGAALANLMFCRPGTRVLEIFPDNFRDEGFLKLARAMGLDYDFVRAGRGDFRQDFLVDPRILEAAGPAPADR